MDKIRALKYFLKVAETSSLSRAAKSFSVPASSVSRRIRELETELQVELFHRSTRVVKLSAIGEIYYEQIKAIIQSLENADDLVSQPDGDSIQTWRMAHLLKFRYLMPRFLLPGHYRGESICFISDRDTESQRSKPQ